MDAQDLGLDIPRQSLALGLLVEIIDDPKANARERLKAVRMLKMGLCWLQCLVEAPQTAPDLRKDIIEALCRYRRSNAAPRRMSRLGDVAS
ncbi:MAG: hypothetical protein WCA56_18400 [Xanthobacteraceae bacterium]